MEGVEASAAGAPESAPAADGANTGPYSTVSTFSVVAPVVIEAPVAKAPTGTLTTNKPDFSVTNGRVSGTKCRRSPPSPH